MHYLKEFWKNSARIFEEFCKILADSKCGWFTWNMDIMAAATEGANMFLQMLKKMSNKSRMEKIHPAITRACNTCRATQDSFRPFPLSTNSSVTFSHLAVGEWGYKHVFLPKKNICFHGIREFRHKNTKQIQLHLKNEARKTEDISALQIVRSYN